MASGPSCLQVEASIALTPCRRGCGTTLADGIIECVPNISEGATAAAVAAIADAVRAVPGVRLLDVQSDASHHRSVLTFAGDARAAAGGGARALRGDARAASTCAGTAASIRALAPSTSCRSCPSRARRWPTAWRWRARPAPRSPRASACRSILYEEAARVPARRNLEDIRRGEFEGLAAKLAIAGVGARLRSGGAPRQRRRRRSSARGCRSSPTTSTWPPIGSTWPSEVAAAVRESSGGFRYVKAMGLRLERARHRPGVDEPDPLREDAALPRLRGRQARSRALRRRGARERGRRPGAGARRWCRPPARPAARGLSPDPGPRSAPARDSRHQTFEALRR